MNTILNYHNHQIQKQSEGYYRNLTLKMDFKTFQDTISYIRKIEGLTPYTFQQPHQNDVYKHIAW